MSSSSVLTGFSVSRSVDPSISLWKQAIKKCGLSGIITKQSIHYDRVKKMFETIHPGKEERASKRAKATEHGATFDLWQKACEQLKIQFAKKGSEEYNKVKARYTELLEICEPDLVAQRKANEKEFSLWNECVHTVLGEKGIKDVKFVSKGTEEYDKVKELYTLKQKELDAMTTDLKSILEESQASSFTSFADDE